MTKSDLMPKRKNETGLAADRHRSENRWLDLRNQIDRFFDEFPGGGFELSPFFSHFDRNGDFNPRLDVNETEKEFNISAELPGLTPEDIDISIKDNMLTISGEKRAEKEEGDKEKGFYHVERSYGSFYRSIPLPSEVEEDKIEANLNNGLLKIALPKSKEAQKQFKRIPIKTG